MWMSVDWSASWDRLALSTRRWATVLKGSIVVALGTEAPVPVGFVVYPLAHARGSVVTFNADSE